MKQRKKFIYNYVLVLFHDPHVDEPIISTDPDVSVKKGLSDLMLHIPLISIMTSNGQIDMIV